jgi:hypothetical protein
MKPLIWGEDKTVFFFAQDWTAKISLKSLEKLAFWRRRFVSAFERMSAPTGGRFARRAARRGALSRQAARAVYRLLRKGHFTHGRMTTLWSSKSGAFASALSRSLISQTS